MLYGYNPALPQQREVSGSVNSLDSTLENRPHFKAERGMFVRTMIYLDVEAGFLKIIFTWKSKNLLMFLCLQPIIIKYERVLLVCCIMLVGSSLIWFCSYKELL